MGVTFGRAVYTLYLFRSGASPQTLATSQDQAPPPAKVEVSQLLESLDHPSLELPRGEQVRVSREMKMPCVARDEMGDVSQSGGGGGGSRLLCHIKFSGVCISQLPIPYLSLYQWLPGVVEQ